MKRWACEATRLAAAGMLLVGFWCGSARADAVTDANVAERVQSAQTAADHEQLAEFFRAKAKAAGKSAQQHRGMIGVMRAKPPSNWRRHCQRLVRDYETQQADYNALAAEQQKLADTAGKAGMQHGM